MNGGLSEKPARALGSGPISRSPTEFYFSPTGLSRRWAFRLSNKYRDGEDGVTSAVESQSAPTRSQTGCVLGCRAAGGSTQGFELRLGAAERRRRPLDGRDLALEVLAIGGGEQARIVKIGRPAPTHRDRGSVT